MIPGRQVIVMRNKLGWCHFGKFCKNYAKKINLIWLLWNSNLCPSRLVMINWCDVAKYYVMKKKSLLLCNFWHNLNTKVGRDLKKVGHHWSIISSFNSKHHFCENWHNLIPINTKFINPLLTFASIFIHKHQQYKIYQTCIIVISNCALFISTSFFPQTR